MNRILAPVLTSVLVLAACGASSAPAATAQATKAASAAPAATQAAAASAAPAAAAPAGPARKIELGATNDRYSISTLEVKAGEKLEFVLTNSGDEKHNLVGIGEGISIVSPDFDSGQTVSWTWIAPTKLGTFKFQCSYHKNVPPITVTVK